MNLYQCCTHLANLLHTPVRLFSVSGLLTRQYPAHRECQDLLTRDHAFRKMLLKSGRKEFPVLYIEQQTLIYGVLALSDGQSIVLGPNGLVRGGEAASCLPLCDFCEGLLLLDDFYWGRSLDYETLLALNFTSHAGTGSIAQTDSLLSIRCKEEIRRRLYEKITTKDLAVQLAVSPAYLSRVFRQEQGVTLTHYITQEKIRQACEMLRSTDHSYEAIAYELGFSSQSYFGAVFKKLEGLTPRDYRRQNRMKTELNTEENNLNKTES